jgi:hypothetical protein
LLEEVFRILDTFDSASLQHVYTERNKVADKLSKEGVQLDFGRWMIIEDKEGTHYEYFHRPFIEPLDMAENSP